MATKLPLTNNENRDGRRGAAISVDGAQKSAASAGKHAVRPSVHSSEAERAASPRKAEQVVRQEPRVAQNPEMTAAQKRAMAMKKRAVAKVRKEEDRRSRLGMRLALFVGFFAIFALGFFLRGIDPLMARLDPSLVTSNAAQMATQTVSVENSVAARMSEVEKVLSENSLEKYDLDAVSASLIQDWATLTEDPYARYFTEDKYALYSKETMSKSYSGVGVLFAEYEGQTYAADVFPDSAADLAGVHQGDYVSAIDGNSSQQWTPSEVINSISRKEGDSVVITWRRPSGNPATEGTTFSTSLEYRSYQKQNVSAQIATDSVGYIAITQLSDNAKDLVSQAIVSLAAGGATSYVLDLRGCAGGYLTQAVDIASLFVKSGILVQIQTKEGVTTKSATGATETAAPLVVLIDEKTSGSAEVLAAALRDNERASLVGSTTIGKGSVQVVQALSFGGALRYTAAYYLSPKGHSIQGQGVSPDTAVSDSYSQLTVALRLAQSL